MLRLPDGMRDKIADAAKSAGRSMNAEIVHRLEASFDSQPEDINNVSLSAETLQDMIEAARRSSPLRPLDGNTVYVLLDTDGMPISWNEAVTHLGELSRAANMALHSQHSFIVTPEIISNSKRQEEEYRLIDEYAKLRRARRKRPGTLPRRS